LLTEKEDISLFLRAFEQREPFPPYLIVHEGMISYHTHLFLLQKPAIIVKPFSFVNHLLVV
jgi:hypothetical protein